MGHFLHHYLGENPWYLVGGLGLVAAGFLIALRVTQDGRHLIRALAAIGLAALVLVVEQVWVTEAERIEWVVHDLADAVSRSDGDRVLALMDDHVSFSMKGNNLGKELDVAAIREALKDVTFDWLHVSHLSTSAGEQTRRGTAEFRVGVSGTYQMSQMSQAARNFAAPGTEWSLGFRKTPSGDWKILRITALAVPPYAMLSPMFRYKEPSDPAPAASASGPETPEPLRTSPPARVRPFGRGRGR